MSHARWEETRGPALIRIQQAIDSPGAWTWAVLIDGGEYDSGEAINRADAYLRARRSLHELEQRQSGRDTSK